MNDRINIRLLKAVLISSLVYITITSVSCNAIKPKENKADYPISVVPFTSVTLTDNFWSKRIETNRTVTIPFGFNKCEEEGRVRNFARAGGLLEGKYEGQMPFDDTDVYKIIEGASYSLTIHPDKELEAYIGGLIEKIAAAQEDDGYICTWKTLDPTTTPAPWVNPGPRWHHLAASHELYNAGHMYEAAFAHYRATGKSNFLDIALKNADLIDKTFGPEKNPNPPGHQIIETGLVKLYRATKNQKYLNLARFFLDQRGNAAGRKLYGPYNQDHKPVTQQDEAVGHAVRAVYMYAAMADIAGIENDPAYLNAVDKIWENVVSKKLYITGGIGARHQGESFGNNYELPNKTSYNETCAAIGSIYWNHRMFLLHGDAKYIDVLERTLYNGMISGVSLSGDKFFYPNCLESDGKYKFNRGTLTRQPWFDCSCCPSNVTRFIPSVPDYIYAHQDDSLYVNLFIAGTADIEMDKTSVKVTQQTDYPWDGKITIKIDPKAAKKFAVNIRIPGWAANKPVPSDLYSYLDENKNPATIKLNGKPANFIMKNGFAVIDRKWSKGDTLELDLPMPVRRVIAIDKVKDDINKTALVRGPLVYCAEWVDNDNKVLDMVIPDDAEFKTEYKKDLLNGVTVITGDVLDTSGKKRSLTAIPYYAWSHRSPGEMAVWLPRKTEQ
ncbi:MAG: glycoside hydrolase family 127 protein [Sedimentisphaerales bacterium]|nr:glycoside hydrolase family 127 protein [Sedimentisphaerales bacterium]